MVVKRSLIITSGGESQGFDCFIDAREVTMAGAKGGDSIRDSGKKNEDDTDENVAERQARIDKREAQKLEDEKEQKIRTGKFIQQPKYEDEKESSVGARSKIYEQDENGKEKSPGSDWNEDGVL